MKTAVITGGTSGIGEACVRLFSEKGYRVFFIYRSSEEKARCLEKKTNAVGIRADISDFEETAGAIDFVLRQSANIDVLVNNAGISMQKLFIDMTKNEWNKVIDIDQNGIYNVSLPVVKKMISQKSDCKCFLYMGAVRSVVRGCLFRRKVGNNRFYKGACKGAWSFGNQSELYRSRND